VAYRSDSFMFLYSAADGLTRHARQVEWRGSAGAAGKRLRSGDTAIRPVWKTRTRANWNSRREQTQGALTRSPITSWMHTPTGLVPAMARSALGGEEKPERRLENRAFGLRRPRGMAQPTIYCRESEILLSSAHEQSCRSAGHQPQPRHHSGAANGAESAEKNSFPLLAAQPIDKSRFGRENPRKSKEIQPSDRGAFAAKQPRGKKTQMDTGSVATAAEKEPNRLHPKAKRPKASDRCRPRRTFVTERLILLY
jgi:hypothetical protein